MKKVIALLAFTMLSSTAYAATVDQTVLKGFNRTKNVTLIANNDMTNNVATVWSVCSAHTQGDKEFVTTSAFGGVASKTVVPGTTNCSAAPAVPNTPTDSAVPSGYTTM